MRNRDLPTLMYRARACTRMLAVFVILSTCGSIAACSSNSSETSTTVVQDVLPVRVQNAERQEIIEQERAEATIRPLAEVSVVAKQNGEVESLDADAGDTVTKDQILLRLHNDETSLGLRQAQNNYDTQEKEYQSSKDLAVQGYLSDQAFEKIKLARDQAKNALDRLRVHAKDETIRAPITGVVLKRQVERGQQVAIGTPLMTIADLQELRLRMPIRESALRRVRQGQAATVTLRALDDASIPAEVVKIFPSVDANTGTIEVELRLSAHTLPDGTLIRPGMYARGEIDVQHRDNVLVIPRKAIVEEGEIAYVFVLDQPYKIDEEHASDNAHTWVVRRQKIETAWTGRGLVEIVDGLHDTDRFVVLGQGRLHDGSVVRVVEDAP